MFLFTITIKETKIQYIKQNIDVEQMIVDTSLF